MSKDKPTDKQPALKEISDNRDALEPITKSKRVHFCYPSGFWNPEQFRYLKQMGVKSATTCDSGFNYPETNPLALKRFLDGQCISQIEFEAEMSGFLEIFRKIRKILKRK